MIIKHPFWKDEFFWNNKVYVPLGCATLKASLALGLSGIKNILDLGTGTGCLLCSLLREYSDAVGVGIDINPEAIKLAKQNSQALELEDRTTWIESSWCENIPSQEFDLIITIPPYMPEGTTVTEKIQDCPHNSVYGGMPMFKEMLASINKYLPIPRYFVSEINGYRQVSFMIELLEQYGYKRIVPILFNKEPLVVVAFRNLEDVPKDGK